MQCWELALGEARSVRHDGFYIAEDYNNFLLGNSLDGMDPDGVAFYRFAQQFKEDGYAPSALGFQGHELLTQMLPIQWNSTTTEKLDSNGMLAFRGFYGNYTATVAGGSPVSFSLVDNRTAAEHPWTTSEV